MANISACKGFFCGGNIKEGSITKNKLDVNSVTELIREIITEGSKDWLVDVINGIIKENKNNWFKDSVKDVLDDMIDDADGWLKDWIQKWLQEYVTEEWFRDLICSLDCMVEELFDVIPTDITFAATGGEATVQIIVDDDVEWEITE